jgi:hypothetical protein
MNVQVAAVRVDMSWGSRKGLVSCIASLTRRLSKAESRRMDCFPEYVVEGDRVTYSCRAEETEAFGERLSALLRRVGGRPGPRSTG